MTFVSYSLSRSRAASWFSRASIPAGYFGVGSTCRGNEGTEREDRVETVDGRVGVGMVDTLDDRIGVGKMETLDDRVDVGILSPVLLGEEELEIQTLNIKSNIKW